MKLPAAGTTVVFKQLRCFCSVALAVIVIIFSIPSPVASKQLPNTSELQTRYLLFQVFTPSLDDANALRMLAPTPSIAATVESIIGSIGTAGSARQKLGFCVGPLTLSNSDEQVIGLIRDSFRIARKYNVAVAFHIDDQMFWDKNIDLQKDKSANIEWLNWKGIPCTGRRLDWALEPSRIAPQLCLNSAAVQTVVTKRATLIGSEIKREIDQLQAEGKAVLFAGIIAGWESRIGRDFATNSTLGYHALVNRGISSNTAEVQCDTERSKILKEFIETWAKTLAHAGIPANKIYAHIAFTDQGLHDSSTKIPYAQLVDFATPDVVFSKFYRPGFSTYPMGDAVDKVCKEVERRGSPPWISAEGTNVVPNGMPGEATMQTYLAKMFNHGAVMVNIFSWGMGGEAHKDDMFRRATENAEAVSDYRKFLSGAPLQERSKAAGEFSLVKFREKIHAIQVQVPKWIERTRRPDLVQPMMVKLDQSIKENRWQDADKMADQIVNLVADKSSGAH
jgi:hypothetical protein